MPQLDWSIQIVSVGTDGNGNDIVGFQPQMVPPAAVGSALQVQLGDVVSWGNRTNRTVQLCLVNGDGTIGTTITEEIPPDGSSNPKYIVVAPLKANDLVFYCAKSNANEKGQILVANNNFAPALPYPPVLPPATA